MASIVLVKRGKVSFDQKAQCIKAAGGAAAMVLINTSKDSPMSMKLGDLPDDLAEGLPQLLRQLPVLREANDRIPLPLDVGHPVARPSRAAAWSC